jgi:hypothetical protein
MTWRGWLTLAIVAIAALAVVGFIRDPFGWRKAKVERLETEVATKTDENELAAAATVTVERFHTTERIIRETVEKEADAVQALPGAETPIDPDRRAVLCAALSRLRDGERACDDTDTADAAGTVR